MSHDRYAVDPKWDAIMRRELPGRLVSVHVSFDTKNEMFEGDRLDATALILEQTAALIRRRQVFDAMPILDRRGNAIGRLNLMTVQDE